jgi:hypothetical protein
VEAEIRSISFLVLHIPLVISKSLLIFISKPIVAAMPNDVQAPGRLRNIQDDPFAVRGNRETVAGELLTYDPTPGTWMYDWDNDMTEDAKFAVSTGFVFRHLPTSQDAAMEFFADGRTTFAFQTRLQPTIYGNRTHV